MNKNDIIEIQTERMSFGDAAVGRFRQGATTDSIVVFVHGACAGEKVKARITQRHKRYWDAVVVEIVEPSIDRVTPPCPYFGFESGKCGGCQWQHLSYEAQIRAKTEILIHQISRQIPKTTKLSGLKSRLSVHPAQNIFGYRNRIQMHGTATKLGFFSRNSHEIVDIKQCLVAHEIINTKIKGFRSSKDRYKIEFSTDDQAINRPHAARGFAQVNDGQNNKMKEIVRTLASRSAQKNLLLDLYGGNGNLSHLLTGEFKNVLCVDSHGFDNPLGGLFIRADIQSFMKKRTWEKLLKDKNPPDCIILDPPRTGLGGEINDLMDLNTQDIIYVSCDPSTLSRDLSKLLTKFKIEELHLIDMFPQTYHIESITYLKKQT